MESDGKPKPAGCCLVRAARGRANRGRVVWTGDRTGRGLPRRGRGWRTGAVSPRTEKGFVSRGSASAALRVVDDLLWQMEATGPLCSCPPPPPCLSLSSGLFPESALCLGSSFSTPACLQDSVRTSPPVCARTCGSVRAFVGEGYCRVYARGQIPSPPRAIRYFSLCD